MKTSDLVTKIKGVGEKRAELLKKLDIETVEDLLYHRPSYYRDLRQHTPISVITEGELIVVKASVTMPPRWVRRFGKFSLFTFEISDGTAVMDINIFNLPFLFTKYKPGDTYRFYGKAKIFKDRLQMDNPEVFAEGTEKDVLPYYPLTAGITQTNMRQLALLALGVEIAPFYSGAFMNFAEIQDDLSDFTCLHSPSTMQMPEFGRKSLAKKEFLLFNCMLSLTDKEKIPREPLCISEDSIEAYTKKLPYTLTGAQLRVIAEIYGDLKGSLPANRLVQGDVGSGKTAVAMFGAFACAIAKGQSIIMAPTELLAEQHAAFAREIFGEAHIALLKGSTKASERKKIFEKLASGETVLLISTHAVLYSDIAFSNLQLVIIDEQHRFGVEQRAKLIQNRPDIHMISLSATPIPRSLAMILYGNADISVIDEMPPARIPPKTFIMSRSKRGSLYKWLDDMVKNGEKAYIVCPLLEPSEGIEAVSVQELSEDLHKAFPDMNIAMLHGKMKDVQKQEIMSDFRKGKANVLVSTTVVEVGVDVSDATIMVVENADRFGLAQLHQLRGRVGRGDRESYCYFVSDGSGIEHLQILKDCNDGFEIAKQDLQFRGSGEFFGTKQHGEESFRVADILQDADLLLSAQKILEKMPEAFPEDYRILTKLAESNLNDSNSTAI